MLGLHDLSRYRNLVLASLVAATIVYYYYYSHSSLSSPDIHTKAIAGYLALSTKTPYPSDVQPKTPLPNASSSLQLVQVQYIVRHGARYPTESDMKRIKRIYKKLRHVVPKSWMKRSMVDEANAGKLATAGAHEIQGIAQRAAAKYSLLLKQSSGARLRFVSSQFSRSRKSAGIFRDVLAQHGHKSLPVEVLPKANDTALAMKFTCPLWRVESQRAMDTVKYQQSTFDTIHGSTLQGHVHGKLPVDRQLSVGEISTVYLLCGHDISLFAEYGHWCTLLNTAAASLLEWRKDIKYSRKYGPYGHSINKKIACSLFTQTFYDIERAIADPSNAASTFRFGHAETIMFASTLLGLEQSLGNKSMPIDGNMTLEDALSRGFRTTILAPFSSNLVFEVYLDKHSQAYLQLLLNERAVMLPTCSSHICPLQTLRNRLKDYIGCDYDSVCQRQDGQ